MNGCLTLVGSARAGRSPTVEGLAGAGVTHPVQQAFADPTTRSSAVTAPRQLMSAVACIAEGHATDDASVASG